MVRNLVNKLNQRGDTIVEVLIAAAVVGVMLVASFATANKSSQSIRDAAEHDEAQKIAVGAVEGLDNVLKNHTAWLDSATPSVPLFCQGGSQAATTSLGTAVTTLAEFNAPGTHLNNTDPDCQQISNRYRVVVERPDSAKPDVFIVHVIWDKLGGGRNDVSLVYKVAS